MKHIRITILAAAFATALSSLSLPAAETVKADDSRLVYVGRTLRQEGKVSFDWSAVYVRIRFQGNSLSTRVSDSRKNYYNVWIDRPMSEEPDKIIATFGKDSLIDIFSPSQMKARFGKKPLVHDVVIMKRTEGEQGKTTFASFSTDGDFLQAEGLKDRLIEFVGDSYTCGYGSENSVASDPFKPETENSNKTYAACLARYFGADFIDVAHSGMGIARNYADHVRNYYMPDRYLHTFDEDSTATWNARAEVFRPDITLIYLCTNDFSTRRQPSLGSFKANYIRLLKSIKENYGEDHPILCIAGKNDYQMSEYVHAAVIESGLKNVSWMAFSPEIYSMDEMGASAHPNYAAHIKKAYAIAPYIATMTGWQMTSTPIR